MHVQPQKKGVRLFPATTINGIGTAVFHATTSDCQPEKTGALFY